VVIINRAEILNKYRRHISYVSLKISRILELLKASCKSFCVHVPVWGDFKEVTRSLILPEFQINPRSYVCEVALQSCCDKSCFEKTSKQSFGVKQIQLGRTWRKEFGDWEAQIHYQDLRTKVWYVIMYLTPYEILYEIRTYT
jgi:hypothetical protein